jgi:hypothetical protein
VHVLALRLADAVDGAHDPRSCVLGAAHQRVEPARSDQEIVVDEHDVTGADGLKGDVARLVGREPALRADERDAPVLYACLEIVLDAAGRAAVHVHDGH